MAEKEALTAQRDVLERRKLRSSQAAARDIVNLSLQIDSIESALSVKMKGQFHAPNTLSLSGCGILVKFKYRTTCQLRWVWLTPTV